MIRAGNREEEARRVHGSYAEHHVNPFAGFAVVLVQIPIFIEPFILVFREGMESLRYGLYSFIQMPS